MLDQITFSTSVFKNYDAFTSLTFGDVQLIKQNSSVNALVSPSDLDDAGFESTYVKIAMKIISSLIVMKLKN